MKNRNYVRQPRLSEKSVALNNLNQYVFTVAPKATKLQIKKELELTYGIKIAKINTVLMDGKIRRYGRFSGRTNSYKKAIVTLTKDSKKPEVIEAA